MDGRRFDAWTRLLAHGLPRRRAVKTIAGAGVAAVATRSAMHEAEACSTGLEAMLRQQCA